jgi:hypothetical protein
MPQIGDEPVIHAEDPGPERPGGPGPPGRGQPRHQLGMYELVGGHAGTEVGRCWPTSPAVTPSSASFSCQ